MTYPSDIELSRKNLEDLIAAFLRSKFGPLPPTHTLTFNWYTFPAEVWVKAIPTPTPKPTETTNGT